MKRYRGELVQLLGIRAGLRELFPRCFIAIKAFGTLEPVMQIGVQLNGKLLINAADELLLFGFGREQLKEKYRPRSAAMDFVG